MSKKIKIALAVAILGIGTMTAASGLAGTQSDPLVTKSYVDDKISEIIGGNQDSDMLIRLNEQEKLIVDMRQELDLLQQNASGKFEIIVVPQGSIIYGNESTEMIIRAGEGEVVALAAGGIQDITDGKDIAHGEMASKNNLLLVPRSDGRGLLATKQLTVMVRGGYILSK